MYCRVCNTETKQLFTAKILWKHNVNYYSCPLCEFVQTENPYRLDESYADPINIEDTGLVYRNILFSKMTALIIRFFYNKHAKFLDYAWWYGLFCRLMRDMWYDFYRDDVYTKNLLAKWFEYDGKWKAELVTAFEVFEHLENPCETIEKILSLWWSILFSTKIIPSSIPQPDSREYYGLSHGQHIWFFSIKTLKYLGKKYNLHMYSNWLTLHLLTPKKLRLPSWMFGIIRCIAKLIPIRFYTNWSKISSDMAYVKKLRNHLYK